MKKHVLILICLLCVGSLSAQIHSPQKAPESLKLKPLNLTSRLVADEFTQTQFLVGCPLSFDGNVFQGFDQAFFRLNTVKRYYLSPRKLSPFVEVYTLHFERPFELTSCQNCPEPAIRSLDTGVNVGLAYRFTRRGFQGNLGVTNMWSLISRNPLNALTKSRGVFNFHF